ncbi:right-handed parallel beta-helix repeat-containing protein [Streptomyces sp. TG1A-8]|uniref:right-handed parallel beta-helix repeat-containing protein n=1 Tax=Streptomyces sp. TG1A-8 TaxID=3051385 RepID=UPI00265B9A4D|nr:right-handed parallel beta-helix repeat-containing protein [Streptomyces sp. TG1A-8]MDO0927130.1 right-handed parallel beta-helix repeat-containing protein [Streptomyces sp. TG1A-8]
MKRSHLAYLACTAALAAAGVGAAPAAAGHLSHRTHVVHPGQSIQKAVDSARAGDTVLVLAGTYRESVRISTPWLTLRGAGAKTVIEPAAKKPAKPATKPGKKPGKKPAAKPGRKPAAKSVTKPAAKSAGRTGAKAGSCAGGGNGICVVGTKKHSVEGVTVAGLTVTGFSHAGVLGTSTDSMTVREVRAVKNGVWGIALERSVHGLLQDNHARANGDAGLFLANTIDEEAGAYDAGETLVEHNRLEGNRIGVTVRRLRNITVAENDVTGNCAGVFVVGDENKPKAGDLAVAANRVTGNNKSCPKTERLPALQGSGIVLTGTEKALVAGNEVSGNAGGSPLSGGIVLFKSFVGVSGEKNRISDNTLEGNAPADLVNTETNKSNVFEHNTCRASRPAGLC